MPSPAKAVQRFVQSPVGCAFLLIVERDEVPPAVAVTPTHAMQIACAAHSSLSAWAMDTLEQCLESALRQGRQLEALAQELVSQPGAAWWFAPLDRQAQVWIPKWEGRRMARLHPERCFDLKALGWIPRRRPAGPELQLRVETPSAPASRAGAYYGELFKGWQATSTAVNGFSCWEIMLHVGEWGGLPPSHRPPRVEVLVAADARVFEILGPDDWHALCCRYPDGSGDRHPLAMDAMVPHWPGVAEDWDAVHLTFWGALTTPWVAVASAGVRSKMWLWNSEAAVWLRDDVLTVGDNIGPVMVDYLYPEPQRRKRWTGYERLAHAASKQPVHRHSLQDFQLPERLRSGPVERILRAPARASGHGDDWPAGGEFIYVKTDRGEVRFVRAEDASDWEREYCVELINGPLAEGAALPRYRRFRWGDGAGR